MRYREAVAEDVPALVDLFYAAMPWAPDRTGWEDEHAEWLRHRFGQAVALDAGGTWVAEEDGRLVGTGCGHIREGIWVLTLLGVRPEAQSGGVGGELFRRALDYGSDARAWMVAASDDTRGWRLYAGAGFDLLPCIEADGEVGRRQAAPAVSGVREGSADDLESHCADVDRRVRGGARTPDLELILRLGGRLLLTPRGYAVTLPERLSLLAAEDQAEAEALLWTCIADAGPEYNVAWITGAQQWAIRIALAARLPLRPTGPYLVKGDLGPLQPWLPHGAFL